MTVPGVTSWGPRCLHLSPWQPGRRDSSCRPAPHPPPSRPQPPCPGPLTAYNYPQYWLYGLLEMGDQAAGGSSLKGTQEIFNRASPHPLHWGLREQTWQPPPPMPALHRPSPSPQALSDWPHRSTPATKPLAGPQGQNANCSLWPPSLCVVWDLPHLSQSPCPPPLFLSHTTPHLPQPPLRPPFTFLFLQGSFVNLCFHWARCPSSGFTEYPRLVP